MKQAAINNIPKLRFPEFSDVWSEKNLKDAGITIIDGDRGKNYPNGKDFSNHGYCLFLNTKNVTNAGFLFDENSFITQEKDLELKKGKLQRKDLVLTTRGTVGNIAYYDNSVPYNNIRINSGMVILRSAEDKILPKYLYMLSKSNLLTNQIKTISFGSAQPQVTVAGIQKLKIPVSSIVEQGKIAEFLTLVNERIEEFLKKVEMFKKYKKGVMQKIFSKEIRFEDERGKDYPDWEEKKLGNIATIKTGNLNVDDALDDGEFTFFDRSEEVKRYKQYTFDNEALIYSGEGSEFFPRYFKGKYGLHQRSYTIFDVQDMDMKFLYYFMLTKNNHFLKMAVGSTVKSLRMDCFTKCNIVLPNKEEQRKIAEFLTAIDEKIQLEERRLAEAKKFKKSLLQQMFI